MEGFLSWPAQHMRGAMYVRMWLHLAEAIVEGKWHTCSADCKHVSCNVDVVPYLFDRIRSQTRMYSHN